MLTESLTVRILGDSSGLQRELAEASSRLDEFQSRMSDLGESTGRMADGFDRVQAITGPFETASQLLQSLQQQIVQLAQQPVMLNVQPALAALAQLNAMLQATAANVAALNMLSAGAGMAGGGRPDRMAMGLSEMASPAAGAFAGPALLQVLNETGRSSTPAVRSVPGAGPVSSTTNHFGGITVNVARAGGVNEVIRDLRLNGAALRHRRG